jgi:hypothetical protein
MEEDRGHHGHAFTVASWAAVDEQASDAELGRSRASARASSHREASKVSQTGPTSWAVGGRKAATKRCGQPRSTARASAMRLQRPRSPG